MTTIVNRESISAENISTPQQQIPPPYSKILVAVDHSECAARAFDYAARLSKASSSSLLSLYPKPPSSPSSSFFSSSSPVSISILHVIQFPPLTGEELMPAVELSEYFEKEGRKLLDTLVDRARSVFGLKVDKTILERGDVPETILNVANMINADLIVIGSRGLGGVKELLLGSVSHKVVNHSKIPVLIVK